MQSFRIIDGAMGKKGKSDACLTGDPEEYRG